MQLKVLTSLFITAVLLSSFTITVMPSANALTVRTDFADRHTSASYGNSKICGDHMCGSGEQTKWMLHVSDSQKVGYGKVQNSHHGEEVMHKIVGSNSTSNALQHEKVKMSGKMTMVGNMTNSMKNMTNSAK
jgi:hypothetical protein